jgi:hypothetical protein
MSKAEIIQMKPQSVVNWMCSSCGVDAGCNCGAPLMSKGQRIAEAIVVGDQRSSRAIAKELGVSHTAVDDVRNSTGKRLPVGPRTGLDGRTRRLPRRQEAEFDEDIAIEQTKQVFLLGAHEAIDTAEYRGPVDDEIIQTAKDAAAAWCRLVSKLTGENT